MTNYQQTSKLLLLVISGSLIRTDGQPCVLRTLISDYGDLKFGLRPKGDFLFPPPWKSRLFKLSQGPEVGKSKNHCGVRGKINSSFCCYHRYKTGTAAERAELQVRTWLQREFGAAAIKTKSKGNWQQTRGLKLVCHESKSKKLGFSFPNSSSRRSRAFP